MTRRRKKKHGPRHPVQGGKRSEPLPVSLDFLEPSAQSMPYPAATARTMDVSEIVHMAECLAIGMCDRGSRWKLDPIKLPGFQGSASYWRFWENLGKIVAASSGHQTVYFKLPSAESVIALLEKRRLQWLHSLRVLFLDSEEFVSAFLGGQVL